MALPLGNQPPSTPISPGGTNNSPDGSPRSGGRSWRKEPLDPNEISQDDFNACQRNLDLRTEELFQNLLQDIHRANETSKTMLGEYKEQIRITNLMWADIQSLEWQRMFLVVALVVAVVVIVVLLCLLLI